MISQKYILNDAVGFFMMCLRRGWCPAQEHRIHLFLDRILQALVHNAVRVSHEGTPNDPAPSEKRMVPRHGLSSPEFHVGSRLAVRHAEKKLKFVTEFISLTNPIVASEDCGFVRVVGFDVSGAWLLSLIVEFSLGRWPCQAKWRHLTLKKPCGWKV